MNVYVAAMLRNSYAAVASHRNPLAGIGIAVVNKLPAPYRAALGALRDLGLSGSSTLYDIGARWTELDITLRVGGVEGTVHPDRSQPQPPPRLGELVATETGGLPLQGRCPR